MTAQDIPAALAWDVSHAKRTLRTPEATPFLYDALARVDPVRSYATAHGGPKAHFMAYGTVRMADDVTQPGSANKYLPELLALTA